VTASRFRITLSLACTILLASSSLNAMGLRSLVALPVDKGGTVIRFTLESANEEDRDDLATSVAYGISAQQTLLLALPYRIEPEGRDRTGDFSVLYRHISWREDSFTGTNRLGLLIGALLPSQSGNDAAAQAGLVFTHFKNRNEIDADILYRSGSDDRPDSARYDISWQYRLRPAKRPDWGLVPELNTVLELNARWREDEDTVHQVTAGLQWIHPRMVLDGGIARDISNGDETRVLLSTRFHF
jgi:hypothetical protein